MNNTDLSTRFVKNPSSSNLNKAKMANKMRNLNNIQNENKPNVNHFPQNNAKELSLINEGNEISVLSKDDDPSIFGSENFKRIYSGNSNSIQVEDESIDNLRNPIDNNKNINSRAHYLLPNSNNHNQIGINNVNPNLINLKVSPNQNAQVNNNNHIIINNANNNHLRDDLSRNNKTNFTSNASINFNSDIKNRAGISSSNKNIIHPIVRPGSSNNNIVISSINNKDVSNNPNVQNAYYRDKENKK